MRRFLCSAAALAVAASFVITPSVSAQNSYTWTGTEPTMLFRPFRDGVPSVAGVLKVPTAPIAGGPFAYTLFTYNNPTGSIQTFSAEFLSATDGVPFFTLYLGFFDPLNVLTNYLGDAGSSCIGNPCSANTFFSVFIDPGATVVLMANAVSPGIPTGESFVWNGPDLGVFAEGPGSVVPEPASMTLLATGLVGMIGAGMKRRKKA